LNDSCQTSFMAPEEIKEIGFGAVGKNVLISRKASFYSAESIFIGDNVRIDDFCFLSGNISIGSHIHIAPYALLVGQNGISIHDFSQISSRVSLLSATDDFSGEYLVGPQVPNEYRKLSGGEIILYKHALIGIGSLIFPGVKLREGTAIGAMSFVFRSTKEWTVYFGNPAVAIKERSKRMVTLESSFLESL